MEIVRNKLHESNIGMWIVLSCRCAVVTKLPIGYLMTSLLHYRHSHQQAAMAGNTRETAITGSRQTKKPRSADSNFSVTMP